MKDIYVYDNFSYKVKGIYLWVATFAFFVIYLTYLFTKITAVLYIIPISFIMGYVFYYRIPMSGTGEYSSIVVNNQDRFLKFLRKDGFEILVKYDDITAIDYNIIAEPMARRSIISVNIFLKTGERKNITFSNHEFSLDFLKKLPNDVVVMDCKQPPLIQVLIVFAVTITIFMLVSSILLSLK